MVQFNIAQDISLKKHVISAAQPDPGVGFLRVLMDAGALAQRQPMCLAFLLTLSILNALGPLSKEENK